MRGDIFIINITRSNKNKYKNKSNDDINNRFKESVATQLTMHNAIRCDAKRCNALVQKVMCWQGLQSIVPMLLHVF